MIYHTRFHCQVCRYVKMYCNCTTTTHLTSTKEPVTVNGLLIQLGELREEAEMLVKILQVLADKGEDLAIMAIADFRARFPKGEV